MTLGSRPKLHQLNCLKVGDQQVRVIQRVGVDWKQLGLALHFDYNLLKAIESDNHFKTHESCCDLLQKWLDGGASQPVTWARLIEALRDCEHSKLAFQLKHILIS